MEQGSDELRAALIQSVAEACRAEGTDPEAFVDRFLAGILARAERSGADYASQLRRQLALGGAAAGRGSDVKR